MPVKLHFTHSKAKEKEIDIQVHQKVETFIKSLETRTIAKVLRTIDLLEQFGYQLSMPHCKKVAGSIFELRIRGQQEVRIFYTIRKNTATLLHGFVKKSNRTPAHELEQVRRQLYAFTNNKQ